jgi:hypothetical protein
MSGVTQPGRRRFRDAILLNVLTFETLITGPVIHLLYWAGLGVIAVLGFGIIGTSIGIALREADMLGKLLSLPVFLVGVVVILALLLVWRAFCEFYVAVFRIADDLRALRLATEAEAGHPPGSQQR